MDWQDYTVWGIGLVVVAVLLRRALLFGRRRGRCASCSSQACPLKPRK